MGVLLAKHFYIPVIYEGIRQRDKELVEVSKTNSSTQTSGRGRWLSTDNIIDSGTQTNVPLSVRLTDYGARESRSIETFDHVCDICDARETQTVAFCTQCEQYYCIACCRVHETWTFSRAHRIIDRSVFNEIAAKKPLFERNLVPIFITELSIEYSSRIPCYISIITVSSVSGDIMGSASLSTYHGGKTLFKLKKHGDKDVKTSISYGCHMLIFLYDTNKVLISVPFKHELHTIRADTCKVSPVLHFKTSGECWGIAEFDNGIAVSMKIVTGYSLPDWQVQYLDYRGNIKRQIYYDSQDKPLFSNPKYLASNHTRDILYVSDDGKNAIIALDVCGAVLYKFSHNDLNNPKALTVDDEGNVYVACGDTVIQIHKSGTKHRVLIQKTKDNPAILSVCFNPVSRSLLVGEASHNIKTFGFLP